MSASEGKADIHKRMGRRINDSMLSVRGRVAEPRSAQTYIPARFCRRLTSPAWLSADGACVERAAYSLLHSHDGNSKAFCEGAIAALVPFIGQANGFTRGFG